MTQSHATRWFIVMRKADIRLFSREVDREYFSKPVEVELLYCHMARRPDADHLVQVRDIGRSVEYPTSRGMLYSQHRLTNAQRRAVGIA